MGCGCNRGPEGHYQCFFLELHFWSQRQQGAALKRAEFDALGTWWDDLDRTGNSGSLPLCLRMQVDGCPQATEVPMGSFRHPCPGLSVPSPPGPAVGSPAPRGKLQSAES